MPMSTDDERVKKNFDRWDIRKGRLKPELKKIDPNYWLTEFPNQFVMPVYTSMILDGYNDPTLTEDEALDTADTKWSDIEVCPLGDWELATIMITDPREGYIG